MMKPSGITHAMLHEVLSLGRPKNYHQGHLFGEKKHGTSVLIFIRKGAIRIFTKVESGEITHSISVEDEFCCSNSFFSDVPVSAQLEALESVDVIEIHREKLHDLYIRQPETLQFGRFLAEAQMHIVESNYQIISQKSATERYRLFQQFYPHINGRFPLKHIASWLQIDQATLSRVRSKKKRQMN